MMTTLDDIRSLPLFALSVEHPLMLRASEKIEEAIMSPDTRQVSQLIGPTGVGKSHLKKRLERQIIAKYADEMREDPQFLPVASFTLDLDNNLGFTWKSFYDADLRALGVPYPSFRNSSDARDLIVRATHARRVMVTLIDEAHHMLHVGSSAALNRQAEILKNLAEKTGVKHVCFGTYDLTRLIRANGQLSRRTEVVHFPRYKRTSEDIADFHKLLLLMDQELIGYVDFSLSDETDYLHEGCVGLVGVLRDWLVKAYTNARFVGDPKITKESLAETQLSVLDRKIILREAQDGEAELTATEQDDQLFHKMLSEDGTVRANPRPSHQITERPSNGRRPGERIPRRDSLHV
jgi:hypothetical protein